VFLFYSRYYFTLNKSYSFSLNYRFFLPSSFTIILSFFFIDPCVGLGTVSFFLFYSSLLILLLETDPLFPFSILNSFYFLTHVSLLFPFLVYLLLSRSFGSFRLYFLSLHILPSAFTHSFFVRCFSAYFGLLYCLRYALLHLILLSELFLIRLSSFSHIVSLHLFTFPPFISVLFILFTDGHYLNNFRKLHAIS